MEWTDLFAALPDGAILLDAAGAIQALNPAAKQLLGVAAADWLGRADAPFVPAAACERFAWGERVFSVRFVPVGGASGWLALYADISARVEAEKEFDLFMACLFSDLRSPFTPLVGFSKLLSKAYLGPLSDSQRQAAEILYQSAESGLNKLWGYSEIYRFDRRARTVRLDQHDVLDHVKAIAEKTNERFKDWSGRGMSISIESDAESEMLIYDRQMIEEVLFLLLTTSAMNSGTEQRIVLRLRSAAFSSIQIDVPIHNASGYLADDKRLFKPLAPPEMNNRINFYLARAYVELHGGQFWIESGDEQSAFCFTLPVCSPERDEAPGAGPDS